MQVFRKYEYNAIFFIHLFNYLAFPLFRNLFIAATLFFLLLPFSSCLDGVPPVHMFLAPRNSHSCDANNRPVGREIPHLVHMPRRINPTYVTTPYFFNAFTPEIHVNINFKNLSLSRRDQSVKAVKETIAVYSEHHTTHVETHSECYSR
jgi:hypothetical protein